MKALVAVLLATSALAQVDPGAPPAPVETNGATVNNADTEVQVTAPVEGTVVPLSVCEDWQARGLMEGPAAIGYGAADLVSGRRACARSEIGLGGNLGLVIDRPNFYGNIAAQGLLYGSYAINPKTEVFGTLAFLDYQQLIGALSTSTMSLGDLTLGINRGLYATNKIIGSLVVKVLLPTNSVAPNSRSMGGEVGHAISLRAVSWLEVHAYAGAGFTVGLSAAPLPNLQLLGLVGVQISPSSWFSLVVDLNGGLAQRSFFAPTVALRFRISELGIEIGASKPLAGTDRHFVIGGARFAWRF